MNELYAMMRGPANRGRMAVIQLACALTLALLIDASPAAGMTSPEEMERRMMVSLAAGDWHSSCDFLESLLANYPLHPLARLHYGRLVEMAALQGADRVERLIAKMKKAAELRVAPGRGSCLLALAILEEELLYRHDHERAKAVTAGLKPVREWTLAGPFPLHGMRDMDHPYPPGTTAGATGKVRGKTVAIDACDGWLRPGRYLSPSPGVAYARASFIQEGPAMVHVYCREDYRLFVNGRAAGGNAPGLRRSHRVFSVSNSRRIDLLLKIRFTDRDSRVRVIITDEESRVMGARPAGDDHRSDDAEVIERNVFPHDVFIDDSQRDPASSHARTGLWLHGLGSDEAVEFFKESLNRRASDIVSYHLALSLITRNRNGDHFDGWRIIGRLLKNNPEFVPAGLMRLKHFIDNAEYGRALRESERLARVAPRSPFLRLEVARLLGRAGRDQEFRETLSRLRKDFPESIKVAEHEAEYLRNRDRMKYLRASRALLEKAWTPQRGRAVAGDYLSRGDFRAVEELVDRYNCNHDLSREAVESAIRSGDYEAARTMIFKEIMQSDDPWFYEALYRIDTVMDEDPLMYLQKLLSLDSSRFDIEDYIRYLDSGAVALPGGELRDDDAVAAALKEQGHHPMSILYRNRTFILRGEGRSRGFYEDIVRITDGDGMRRYRETLRRIPTGCIPVRMRIYDEKGGAEDFRGDLRGGELEGFLAGVPNMNAVVHIAYILENPVPVSREGGFFSYPPEYIQGYAEPVGRVSIRVIAPEELTVYFSFRDRIAVQSIMRDGMRRYAVTMEGLEAVDREIHSGNDDTILPYYSFSTMKGPEDYAEWHGWYSGKNPCSAEVDASHFKRKDLESTVAAVYRFVKEEGCPPMTRELIRSNAIHAGNGRQEGVRLARELLNGLGIRSFPAFARDRFRSPMEGYMHHEYYTDTLLLVPLDRGLSLWLDFSTPCLPCGMISDRVRGTDASVMVGTSFQARKITSIGESEVRLRYRVQVAEDGSARWVGTSSLSGIHGAARYMLHDSKKAEAMIWRHIDASFPGFSLEQFRVMNQDDCTLPFILEAEGSFRAPVIRGGGILLRPFAGVSSIHDYVGHARRRTPLAIERPVNEIVTCTWVLPEAFRQVAVASRKTVRASFGAATVEMVKKKGDFSIEVIKSVMVNPGIIGRDDYPEFLEFCRSVMRLEQETISLPRGGFPQ